MPPRWIGLARVALIGSAALVFELTLTRLASFFLQYHYTFLAVAAGIGGMGLGLAAAARWPSPRAERFAAAHLVAAGSLAVFPLWVHAIAGARLEVAAVVLTTGALFAFGSVGFVLGVALEAARNDPRAAYAADAAGACAGVIGAVAALEAGGPPASLAFSVVALGASGFCIPMRPSRRWVAGVATVALTVVAVVAMPGATDAPPGSPLGHRLSRGGRALAHRWDAYARTDLVAAPTRFGFEEVYADGTAPAMIVLNPTDPRVRAAHRRELPYLAFRLKAPRRVLSLGGGAGYDAWLARLARAAAIDVVELNGSTLAFAEARRGTSADALRAREVRVFEMDGRRFLARFGAKYDLIVLALYQGEADARASVALRESSGYTREAIREYLRHLTAGGRVAVLLHDRVLLERLWRTVEAATPDRMNALGVEHARSAPYRYLLYFGPAPFSAAERAALGRARGLASIQPVGRLKGDRWRLDPVDDDRPFFFHTERSTPASLWWVLFGAAALSLFLAFGPTKEPLEGRARMIALASGAGFASLEVLLVQELLPALGSPILALAAVSAAILVGSAAGALAGRGRSGGAWLATLVLTASCTALAFGGDVFRSLRGWPVAAVLPLGAVIAFGLGMLAGQPLPAVLDMNRARSGAIARLFAVAALSAIASGGAVVIVAMHGGYGAAAVIPAACYAALTVLLRRI